jgi:DNA polymerase-3 subunit epsilon
LDNFEVKEQFKLATENYYINELFRKMEFRWKGHLVLPPSLHQSGQEYLFINGNPEDKPSVIKFDKIKSVYKNFCSQKSDWSDGDIIRANIAKEDNKQVRIDYETRPVYLCFDTETSGLPTNYKEGPSKTCNWPKLVQLAWTICDQYGNQIKRENHLICPNNFKISDESYQIHGISNDVATKVGLDLRKVLELFSRDIENVKYIVAHNFEFDFNVVASEMMRIELNHHLLMDKESICTMKETVDFCGIKNSYGNKFPSLLELFKKLFNKNIQAGHNAGYDVILLEMCFLRLRRIGMLRSKCLY